MSLTGVKQLSIIATPPVDRLAARTFVMPFDKVMVKEAIYREKFRGGQMFFVCPRVSDIFEVERGSLLYNPSGYAGIVFSVDDIEKRCRQEVGREQHERTVQHPHVGVDLPER